MASISKTVTESAMMERVWAAFDILLSFSTAAAMRSVDSAATVAE